jgi:hypothetical protein
MWYKQKHRLCESKNNYMSITTHQIINLEIDNIIEDQMVKIGKAMVQIIKRIGISNMVIIKIIHFGKME